MDQTSQNCNNEQSDFMQDLEVISMDTDDLEDRADELLEFCEVEDECIIVADSDAEDKIQNSKITKCET
jgi:hypothetical protein